MARSGTAERWPDDRSRSRRALPTPTAGWEALQPTEEEPLRLPQTPFGRFAFAHGVAAGGDALVTLALANSLFFSLAPTAARSKLLLYLLITLTPFTLLSPFIGPLIDRFPEWRRHFVVGSSFARAFVCVLMAQHLDSVLLFPEAFAILALSKGYAVARSSLTPTVVAHEELLVRANARLSIVGGLMGMIVLLPGALLSKAFGGAGVLWLASVVFVGAALAALRIVTPYDPTQQAASTTGGSGRGSASKNPTAKGGLGANGSAGTNGPVPVDAHAARSVFTAANRRAVTIRVSAASMAIVRWAVGFLTFLLLFEFRRRGAELVWFGLAATASAVGLQLGALLAPALRKSASEERIIVGSLGVVGVAGLLGMLMGGHGTAAICAGLVGLASQTGRLAFDSLVQRDGDHAVRGSAFARFETRFQLMWVVGALVPTIIALPRFVGFLLLLLSAAAGLAIAIIGEPALERINDVQRGAKQKWRRPIRADLPDDNEF